MSQRLKMKTTLLSLVVIMLIISLSLTTDKTHEHIDECFNEMNHIFDSLISNIPDTSICLSFPQTTGTILEGNSQRIVKPVMHLIQQKPPGLWHKIIEYYRKLS